MYVTGLYAAPLALMLVWLSLGVIKARVAARVALGDGDDLLLRRAIRAQGNFVEYVPMALVLMALAEAGNVPAAVVHALGMALVCGRAVHAVGIRRAKEDLRLRQVGMVLTFAVLVIGAGANLWVALT